MPTTSIAGDWVRAVIALASDVEEVDVVLKLAGVNL